jgi:hypothetical protein
MVLFDRALFEDCQKAARELIDHLKANDWIGFGFTGTVNIAGSDMTLTSTNSHDRYTDLQKVYGKSNMTIRIPSQGYAIDRISKPKSLPRFHQEFEDVLIGVVVHEATHVLQNEDEPESFDQAEEDQTFWIEQYKPLENHLPPDIWLEGYYKNPLEIEAHANQLAAEVRNRCLRTETCVGLNFKNALTATHLYDRLSERLGDPVQATAEITNWYQTLFNDAEHAFAGVS